MITYKGRLILATNRKPELAQERTRKETCAQKLHICTHLTFIKNYDIIYIENKGKGSI